MNEISEVFAKLGKKYDAMAKTIEYQRVVIDRLNKQPVCPYICRDTCSHETVYPKRQLDEYTWAEIAMLSQSGMADKMCSVGDTKAFQMSDGSTVHARIIGFNHDESDIGLPLGITFELVETLNKNYQMNAKNTNAGSWGKSSLRKILAAMYDSDIPAELKAVIKPCAKFTRNGDEMDKTIDRLFVPSEQEVFGRKIWSNGGEGKWYEYYRRENTDYFKCKQNGERDWRWLRSPYASSTTNFCNVGSNGNAYNGSASNARGVAFGFCI